MRHPEIRLASPLTLSGPKGSVQPTSYLRRGLIAALALRIGSFTPFDALTDILWGERPPVSARANVRKQLSDLRRDFRGIGCDPAANLHTVPGQRGGGGGGIRYDADADTVDVLRAEGAARAARERLSAAPNAAVRAADDGLEALGGGPFGADLPQTPWFDERRSWAEELRWRLLQLRCTALLLDGNHFDAMADAQRLAGEGGREHLLMAAHFLSGDVVAALAEMDRLRKDFTTLGLDLPQRMLAMHRPILNGDKGAVLEILQRYGAGTL